MVFDSWILSFIPVGSRDHYSSVPFWLLPTEDRVLLTFQNTRVFFNGAKKFEQSIGVFLLVVKTTDFS